MKMYFHRRKFVEWATYAAAATTLPPIAFAEPATATESLFDGRSLAGWQQIENSATTFSSSSFTDPALFLTHLATASDPVTTLLRSRLDPLLLEQIAAAHPTTGTAPTLDKALLSAVVHFLNDIVSGPSLYAPDRFAGITLRAETRDLLRQQPGGYSVMRLNKLLLEDTYPGLLQRSVSEGWTVRDGALASLGTGRGVLYTTRNFTRFRLTFTMRHVSGSPDHQACVLIFCTRPDGVSKPLDALGGIQFQVPNGGHWDYRPGMNNGGGPEFTQLPHPKFDPHEWSRIEILADATTGVARMAIAQPPTAPGVEVLTFTNPEAGRPGPIALQMHNAGLFDEYKDLAIELNPTENKLHLLG